MSFSFYLPTKILFGTGELNELHKQNLPGYKALIVTTGGSSVKEFGYLERLQNQLKKAEIEYVLFDKILPNPILEHVMEGAKIAKEQDCDFIIGLGGGSSIDSAKSIAVMATNDGDYWDYITGGTGKGQTVKNDPLPIVAITTTAGTGTEADPWTVITKGDEKIGFGYEKTFPVLSIVDPELMVSVPPKLTAYQGFDALFHSTEGYLNKIANPISDMLALKAIELIGKSLSTAVHDGQNIQARSDVALANTLAGAVESTSGCISEHSIAHAMSGIYPELIHGQALIMISREYYTLMAKHKCNDNRMIDMAKALGKKDAHSPMDFVVALTKLQTKCNVEKLEMSSFEIKKNDLAVIAQNARSTMGGLYKLDPCEISDNDVLDILEKSYC